MRGLRLALIAAIVLTTWTIVGPPAAHADHCTAGQAEQELEGDLGHICVTVIVTAGNDSGNGDNGGGGGSGSCPDAPKEDCVTDLGVWFASHQCYAQPASPQPGPGNPAWGGRDPSEGQLWSCNVPGAISPYFFVANGQAPLPDPRELAERALGQLDLAVPRINIAPHPPLATYVGLETWLWLPESQWDSLSLTVTAGSTSVTVTATPERVDWNLTEGTTSCGSAGRPWVKGMPSSAKTDCSYTFSTLSHRQPDDKYGVSATIAYSATWTCSGACLADSGDLGEVPSLTSNDAIEVDERQSVVIH